MNDQILRALIGVIGTVTGVLLGWFLQRLTNSTDRHADYREFIAYSEKLIKEVLFITEEAFYSREALNISAGPPYRSVFPNNLKEEIIELHKRARNLDADLAIYLIWPSQSIENLNKHVSTLYNNIESAYSIDNIHISMNVVICNAKKTKEFCYCVWYLCLKKSSFINLIKVKYFNSYKEVRMIYKRYKDEYSYKLQPDTQIANTECSAILSQQPTSRRKRRLQNKSGTSR